MSQKTADVVIFRDTVTGWILPILLLMSSVALLATGVPRFFYELALVPGTPIYERISVGEPVNDAELVVLEQSRLNALKYVKMPKAYTDLGSSYLIRAQRAENTDDRARYAQMAIEVSMKGLDIAPLNAYAWLSIASANMLLGEDHYDRAIVAWWTSVSIAQFDSFLLLQRIHIGILLYHWMPDDCRAVLKDQMRMAYNWHRGRLRSYLWRNKLKDWGVYLSHPQSEAAKYLGTQP